MKPYLEYKDLVWDNTTQEEKRNIKLFQIEAAKIVTCAKKFCHIKNRIR